MKLFTKGRNKEKKLAYSLLYIVSNVILYRLNYINYIVS